MPTSRRLAIGVLGILLVLVMAVRGPELHAELPTTVPGTATADTGAAALVAADVARSANGDEVILTFAGSVLPTVEATSARPPFIDTAGSSVPVAGEAFVRVRLFPARTASFGESCAAALPPPPSTGPGERLVSLYHSCLDDLNGPAPVVPSARAVPDGGSGDVLAATLQRLLEGPDADEAAAGLSSVFSPETAGLLTSATVAADGAATVDFDPALTAAIPEASSAAGSDALLRSLDATVFQFDGVTSATYTLGGSCDDFWAFVQRACTTRTPQDGAAAQYAQTYFGPARVVGTPEVVTEAVLVEDFEAQITWIVGLRAPRDVTVTTSTDPARVIVRVTSARVTEQQPTARPTFTG